MTSTSLFADVEAPVRDWLRAQMVTGLDGRVYVGLPNRVTFPACEVTLIEGGVLPGEAPVADAAFSLSVWGGSPADRTTCAAIAWRLASLLQSGRSSALSGGLVLLGTRVTLGPVPHFDADGTPRYLLDAVFTIRVDA